MQLLNVLPRNGRLVQAKPLFGSARARLAQVAVFAALASDGFAAAVEPAEFAALQQEAAKNGWVRVMVTLDNSARLETMADNIGAIRTLMQTKETTLRNELGAEALDTVTWSNGLGQIGLYVTLAGLRMLSNSGNAKALGPDPTSAMRRRVHDADGSVEAIQDVLNKNGYADVEVFLNLEEGDYDIGKDGKTSFRPTPGYAAEVKDRMDRISGHRATRGFKNLNAARAQASTNPTPSFSVRVDREAFFHLVENPDVRAIRPVGFVDTRPTLWDTDILTRAKTNGDADVIITLRGSSVHSPKSGYMSDKAWATQRNAHQRAFDDILGGPQGKALTLSNHAALGAMHVRMSHAALARLQASADPRILSVQLNRPLATASLTNSMPLVNMPAAWSASHLATGQYIIVLDSGIRKDHEMFKMNGVSKVVPEACFGTTKDSYKSICPNADPLTGDSPLGWSGSGEPYADLVACNALNYGCSHGTHVAGIAAGRSSSRVAPSSLQGGAIGAQLVSAQVFSYDTKNSSMTAFADDLVKALQETVGSTVSGASNPFTVNMSLGGTVYSKETDCMSVSTLMNNAVADLTSRGVPVVVATGNNSVKNAIAWPACVAKAIKVSSVPNDGQGTTVSAFANMALPTNFTGPIFLAPGGGGGSTVYSADRSSTTATIGMSGTSMATPHVSAFYAAIKASSPGISVADATAWIAGAGSVPVTYQFPAVFGTGPTVTFRRLRLPNF